MSKLFCINIFCLLLYLNPPLIEAQISESTVTSISGDTTTLSPPTTINNSTPSSITTTANTSTSTDAPTSLPPRTTTNSSTSSSIATTTNTSTSTDAPTTLSPPTDNPSSSSISTTANTSTSTEAPTTNNSTSSPTDTTLPPTTTILPHNLENTFTWSSSKLDQNPIVVTVPEGYFISVTVSGVSMSNGNYLQIQGGESPSDEATDGRVFANTVQGPVTYLFETSSVYAYCETKNKNTDEDEPKYEFTAVFERTGEPTTTVSTTTTTPIVVPTTETGASVYVTVNISGKALWEYNDEENVNRFKECVVIMGINYCKNLNIHLVKNITNNYVMISDINRCPYSWPHSESCVRIRHKLPIFYNETSSVTSYQLDTVHLEDMWLRWDQLDDQCFSKYSLAVYEEPDIEGSIVWWAIGISLVLLLFIVLLWFLRSFSAKVKAIIKKRRRSDTMSIISSKKESYSSLTPHYLQDHLDTPKLFEG